MKGSRRLNPGVVIALVLLITFASLFVVVFIIASEPQAAGPAVDALDIEAQAALVLEGADAERGAQLVVEHQCVNCHVYAAGQAAPGWYKLAERAAERQPPLSAAAYLYEFDCRTGGLCGRGLRACDAPEFQGSADARRNWRHHRLFADDERGLLGECLALEPRCVHDLRAGR